MTTSTKQVRSEFLGVYNNNTESSKASVPFRAAIRMGHGAKARWLNLGYLASEKVAARIYNMYAVILFKKGAILNDVSLNNLELEEFQQFVNSKAKRLSSLEKARDISYALLSNGHKWRHHTDLQQAA